MSTEVMDTSRLTDWETEDESAIAAAASLPTPNDTPYRTPSRMSRRSSRQNSVSPGRSSPPPLPTDQNGHRHSRDYSKVDNVSILDPRRFTPTLHASLVSEILSLRRDQEEKTKVIEGLEESLHASREETEAVEATLSVTAKESRSLKRQLALLEGGTSSALGELAKERDEAVDALSEVKKRLETTQKKARQQEDDSDRVHQLWAQDKDNWENDKRALERRIHVAEGRLKAVLEEVAAFQAQQNANQQSHDSEAEEKEGTVGYGSETGSIRSMSMTNSVRFSMLNGHAMPKVNGISLADELDFDGEDETDQEGRESVMSMRHRRAPSRDSMLSRRHIRNQSIDSLRGPVGTGRGKLYERLQEEILEHDETESSPVPKVEYTDTGIQYSPPPSPVEQKSVLREENEANQGRKRVHANPALSLEPLRPMVSTSSQTNGPLSPPRTPKSPTRAPPPPPPNFEPEQVTNGVDKDEADKVLESREMSSIATQTDLPSPPPPTPKRVPPPIPIPSISVVPPTSAPATPRESLLPSHFKDAACQVAISAVPTTTASVQTEEIRVDQRIKLLPVHLQPSSISSAPPSPEPNAKEAPQFAPPPRNPRRVNSQRSTTSIPSSPPPMPTLDSYPGNNDNGPLGKDKTSVRRPPRVSSLFAGFDVASSDEADDFADADFSDSDFRTVLSPPLPTSGKRSSITQAVAPISHAEDLEPVAEAESPEEKEEIQEPHSRFASPEPPRATKSNIRQIEKSLAIATNSAKNGAMRRSALISSGVVAHGRARSPSFPETIREPPFPIPTRASSRNPHTTASAPSDGTRSPTPYSGDPWTYHRRSGSRTMYRNTSVRKVRSAAAVARGSSRYRRRGSRSPPPMSVSTAPDSPQLPPLPYNDLTSPRYPPDLGRSRHRQQPSTNTAYTSNTGQQSVGSSNQGTSVVDSIAQTMVGEWMWKYVRRRKSFGVSDTGGGEDVNGLRHRRWVWLAPYERAVLWSSKQPTSGTALLGKSGRKLTIQSVLDVKDENPGPKNHPPLFNRSILILTPARALKFTANSRERHYLWLTALSFLAHSSQTVPDVVPAPLPAPPQQMSDLEGPRHTARLRKNPIRDSIRIAKNKAVLGQPSVQDMNGESLNIEERPSLEAADAPVVHRFSGRENPAIHSRKRSNTGPRMPPPLSFRGFSDRGPTVGTFSSSGHAPASSTAGLSVGTTGSSDIYQSQPSSVMNSGYGMSVSGRSSARTSEASSRPNPNFFDAVGTVRMEAFISPIGVSRFQDYPNEQDEMDLGYKTSTTAPYRRRSRDRRRRSRNRDYTGRRPSRDDWYGGNKTAGEEEWYDGTLYGARDDPFKGF